MSHQTPNSIENLSRAIKSAWEKEASGIAQFGLTAVPARIAQASSGWTIPVASGIQTGSAYELARVLDRLQEHIEVSNQFSVTLFLDSITGGQVPLPPQRKAS